MSIEHHFTISEIARLLRMTEVEVVMSSGNLAITVDEFCIRPQNEYPSYINEGVHGEVHAISDGLIIKIPKYSSFDYFFLGRSILDEVLGEMKEEFEIQRQLYEGGVSVPKPEGIYLCEFPRFFKFLPFKKRHAGIVMERVYGINGAVIEREGDYKLCDKLDDMITAEVGKARSLGFTINCSTNDIALHNTIYNPDNNKLWLIDFSMWKRPSITQHSSAQYEQRQVE